MMYPIKAKIIGKDKKLFKPLLCCKCLMKWLKWEMCAITDVLQCGEFCSQSYCVWLHKDKGSFFSESVKCSMRVQLLYWHCLCGLWASAEFIVNQCPWPCFHLLSCFPKTCRLCPFLAIVPIIILILVFFKW